jgi:hypothetical protein
MYTLRPWTRNHSLQDYTARVVSSAVGGRMYDHGEQAKKIPSHTAPRVFHRITY